jgi:hypothetical protein
MVDVSHPGHVHRYLPELGARRREGIAALRTPNRTTTTAVILSALLLTSACSDNGGTTEPPPTTASPPGPSASSTIDPRAQPAVTAYETFNNRANNALRNPFGADDRPPSGADFTDYAFDPFLAEYQSYVWGLNHDGVQFKGTPPRHHISVRSIRPDATPWPTVTLRDCATEGSNWQAYDIKAGAVLPQTTPTIPPPYASTVTMILFKNKWGVQKVKVDASRTCTG